MKFGRIVLRVNRHRLKELDFRYDTILSSWRPWCHFVQKSVATWWLDTQLLPGAVSGPRSWPTFRCGPSSSFYSA